MVTPVHPVYTKPIASFLMKTLSLIFSSSKNQTHSTTGILAIFFFKVLAKYTLLYPQTLW